MFGVFQLPLAELKLQTPWWIAQELLPEVNTSLTDLPRSPKL